MMKTSRMMMIGSISLLACGEPVAQSPLPPAPDAVVSTAALGEIVVSWRDVSTKETSYEVEFGTVPNVWQPLKTTPADVTTAHHLNVEFGTTYYYRVRACNSDGCSAWVTTSTAWKSGEPPSVTTPLISSIGISYATLTSTVDYGGIRTEVYFVVYDPSLGIEKGIKSDKIILSPNDGGSLNSRQASIPVLGLAQGTTYNVIIIATNPAGTTTSNVAAFTTSRTGAPLPAPALTTYVSDTEFRIMGQIDPGGQTTDFYYQVAAADSSFATARVFNGPTILQPVITRWSASVTNLRPATNYKWRVIAVNQLGTTTSDSVVFRTVRP